MALTSFPGLGESLSRLELDGSSSEDDLGLELIGGKVNIDA